LNLKDYLGNQRREIKISFVNDYLKKELTVSCDFCSTLACIITEL